MLQKKGPLYILPWRCTFQCNFGCAHCTSACSAAAQNEMSTKEALKLVDQAYDFGASFFGVTGGEALLRKDLFEVLTYAHKLGMGTSIITDGRLLDEKAYEYIVKNETKVSISIDGGKVTDDAVRGVGSYDASVKAIEQLSKENLLNCLVYTLVNTDSKVTNVNEADFRDVLDLAAKYGARWVIYHGMIPYSKESLKNVPSPEQNEWAWNKLYDLTIEYKGKPGLNVYYPSYARVAKQRGMPDWDNWYNHFFLGRCFFGKFMSIAENGDAIPCSYNDVHRFGNTQKQSMQEIWDTLQNSEDFQKAKDKNLLKGKCGVCEFKDICGGCRTSAYFYTGDLLGPDLQCAYIPKALREK